MNEQIGLVYLAEQSNDGVQTVKNIKEKKIDDVLVVEFESNLQSFDVMNRNKRMYQGNNIMTCINTNDRIQSQMRCNGWFGEMDHPMQQYKNLELTPERIRSVNMDRRSHAISNPKLVGNLLTAHIETAAGGKGPDFAKEILRGLIPNFSCRSIASLENIGGKPIVIVKELITYDWVLYPSHEEAHATTNPKIKDISITESASSMVCPDVMIPLTELLKDIKESDKNINMVMESFGLSENDLGGFNRRTRSAIFKDGTNRIMVNTTAKSKKKIDDFFTSF